MENATSMRAYVQDFLPTRTQREREAHLERDQGRSDRSWSILIMITDGVMLYTTPVRNHSSP